MTYHEYIKEQIQSFLSIGEVPQSVAIFNISEAETKALYSSLQPIFNKIKDKAKEKIEKEFEEKEKLYDRLLEAEFKKQQQVENKYKSLESRYRNRPDLKEEIVGWEKDASLPHTKEIQDLYNLINNIPKEIQREINEYTLVDFDVQYYYGIREQIKELVETHKLNQRYQRREYYKSQYGKDLPETEEEKQHTNLHQEEVKRFFAKFAIVYNINKVTEEGMSLDYLMEHLMCKEKVLNTMVWGVFCFELNNEWYSKASEELKDFINTKYKVFHLET